MKAQRFFVVVALAAAGCAEPLVGEWELDTWRVDATVTDCDGASRLVSHEASQVGRLTFLVDGTVRYSLTQSPDFLRASAAESPFDAVDVDNASGSWGWSDDAIEIDGGPLTGSWTTVDPLVGDDVTIGSPSVGGTVFEPCGQASVASRLGLLRR